MALDFKVSVNNKVKKKKRKKQLGEGVVDTFIVKNVKGKVPKGEMMVILGASGSGKSTLLQCIARRGPVVRDTKHFHVEADVKWNNVKVVDKVFHKNCGFVTQDEYFFAMLTVRETLSIAARLRLEYTCPDVKERVESLLRKLDLVKCAGTNVGDERSKGVSGGERKRLNIACELISTPNVLLLDEPTSGLDSASASKVVTILKNLATESNVAVVSVLHQPRWKLVTEFNSVMILHQGETLFKGQPVDVEPYFRYFDVDFPVGENIMDVVFDVINGDNMDNGIVQRLLDKARMKEGDLIEVRTSDGESITIDVENSTFSPEPNFAAQGDKDKLKGVSLRSGMHGISHDQPMNPWFYTFRVLLRRYLFEKFKDPLVVQSQVTFAITFGILVGVVFYNLSLDPDGIQSRIGCIAFGIMLQSFIAFDIILLFPKERAIYLRESGQSLYTPSAFFLARTFAEFPSHFLNAAIFAVMVYFMVGLHNFWMFFILIQLATHCGTSLLLAISALSKSLDIANVLASLALVVFFLFDGFYVKVSTLPLALQWFSEISFLGVAIRGIWKNELSGLPMVETKYCGAQCPYFDPVTAQIYYEVDDVDVGIICWQLLGYILAYRFIAFLGVKYLHKK